jgi:hypothetical protein
LRVGLGCVGDVVAVVGCWLAKVAINSLVCAQLELVRESLDAKLKGVRRMPASTVRVPRLLYLRLLDHLHSLGSALLTGMSWSLPLSSKVRLAIRAVPEISRLLLIGVTLLKSTFSLQ